MKLLFDQNLSPKLVLRLSSLFPGSCHVQDVQLDKADDVEIWNYARGNEFSIISKDADFSEQSALHSHPPKFIWIRRGNCSTSAIEEILKKHFDEIEKFEQDPKTSLLLLL